MTLNTVSSPTASGLELGGQWLGPTQDRMYELVEELGLKTVPLYNEGKLVLQLLGKRDLMGPTKGTIPRLGPFALADLVQGIARFGRLSKTVDLERPWLSPDAACSRPDLLSALHALFYSKSGVDLETLMAVDGGAQQDRIMGGSAAVSERMTQALGDSVVLDSPVRTIRQLTQRLPAGSVIKTYLVDDRPFWRDRGLNGQAGSDEGPVKVTFDNTPPGYGRGVMMGFIEGADGRDWARRTPEERRQVVIDCLVRYFGEEAARPLEYLERDWMAEEFSRGCYGAHFTTGAWTAYGPALTEPVGPIHWAGAECSPVWNGYMEGAVRSGEATAKAVLGELSGLAPRSVTWPTGSSVVWNQGSTQRRRGSILATWK